VHSRIAGGLVGVVAASSLAITSFALLASDPDRDAHVVASVHRTAVPVEIKNDGVAEEARSLWLFDHHSNVSDAQPARWSLFDHH
jgi:hypothetical protein